MVQGPPPHEAGSSGSSQQFSQSFGGQESVQDTYHGEDPDSYGPLSTVPEQSPYAYQFRQASYLPSGTSSWHEVSQRSPEHRYNAGNWHSLPAGSSPSASTPIQRQDGGPTCFPSTATVPLQGHTAAITTPGHQPEVGSAPLAASPSFRKSWDVILKHFLQEVGLTQTLRGFEADMLILNSAWEQKKVPSALAQLKQDLTKLVDGTYAVPGEGEPPMKPLEERKLDYVQFVPGVEPRTPSAVTKSISRFLAQNRARNDASNRQEFLLSAAEKRRKLEEDGVIKPGEDVQIASCARVDAKTQNRDLQMKYDIAKNEDGPLRKTLKASDPGTNEQQKNDMDAIFDDHREVTAKRHPALDERLRNIESHVAIKYVPSPPRSLLDRLKFLEDHLIQLEKEYPPWAALHFNQPHRGWPPPPRPTPIIVPSHLTSSDPTSLDHQSLLYNAAAVEPSKQGPSVSSMPTSDGTGSVDRSEHAVTVLSPNVKSITRFCTTYIFTGSLMAQSPSDTKAQVTLTYEGHPKFCCAKCSATIALQDELISKSFAGRDGRGYLMHSATNVKMGKKEDRPLLTGVHTVADVYCLGCNDRLGWYYMKASDSSQKYKEGRGAFSGFVFTISCTHEAYQPWKLATILGSARLSESSLEGEQVQGTWTHKPSVEEFVAAGDFLAYKFPVWTWEKGEASKARDYLPADKQYLMTRGVPCLRRATALAYTDEDEDAERLLSFGDLSATGKAEDEWVETHTGRGAGNNAAAAPGDIDEIPDVDDHTDEDVAQGMGGLSLSSGKSSGPANIPDMDDIPDMEEEDLEGDDEAAVAAPKTTAPALGVIDPSQVEVAKGNLLQVRTYDVMITYDKYYQTPRIWLIGYDENRTPLTPAQIFQDVSADHAFKTVTIEPFPHSATLQAASVHPCKHASVMKKVIERMNAGVIEEQQAQRKSTSGASTPKDKQKKWLFRRTSGNGKTDPNANGDDDIEGMRVDFYLVVFLKFIASIVPTIEVDSTTAF
ncbi:hypothetical protein NM688_g3035 [Phlebia brevispora]|uniref:Uncharacterized protein n=1 Tax=Phlebia brevispora TaxID=194682 RepID=A0ACC1T7K5_9APHY|nr:hypothetical protein NM688_g3035 [Phlebia brevispora]